MNKVRANAGTGAGRRTDFLTHISVFHFPTLRLSIIIAGARGGRAMLYDNVRWKLENETTKAPPSVVRLGHGAVSHFDRPCLDNLFGSETFPAKPDLH